MTTNQGHPIADDQNSVKAGARGPTLLEDSIVREKLQHFDHERIRERVVHARGAGAHGTFGVYDDALAPYISARVLTDPSLETPAFVRFSTVAAPSRTHPVSWSRARAARDDVRRCLAA